MYTMAYRVLEHVLGLGSWPWLWLRTLDLASESWILALNPGILDLTVNPGILDIEIWNPGIQLK